ncbi:hypothetical protein C6366_18180, partial [Desulfonatronum sp. SC1]
DVYKRQPPFGAAMPAPSLPLAEASLDLEHCTSCQACVELCPEVFGWDEDQELPYLKTSQGNEEDLRKAAAYCPKDCIQVTSLQRKTP